MNRKKERKLANKVWENRAIKNTINLFIEKYYSYIYYRNGLWYRKYNNWISGYWFIKYWTSDIYYRNHFKKQTKFINENVIKYHKTTKLLDFY